MGTKYNCFKCKCQLTGTCAALDRSGKWFICLPCLYSFAIIYDGELMHDCGGDTRRGPIWTHHHRKARKGIFYTYPMTMLTSDYSEDGWTLKKARHCNDCKKDCGLGQKDLILFYCGRGHRRNKSDFLKMQCDACFTKEVGMWYVPQAGTNGGGTVNRVCPSVRLYSSPEVSKLEFPYE